MLVIYGRMLASASPSCFAAGRGSNGFDTVNYRFLIRMTLAACPINFLVTAIANGCWLNIRVIIWMQLRTKVWIISKGSHASSLLSWHKVDNVRARHCRDAIGK